jgi:hypothetical protein
MSPRGAGKKDPHFLASESPLYVGRAVAALAADPKVLARTGDVTCSWDVAREFGLNDADGTRPDWGRHSQEATLATKRKRPLDERRSARDHRGQEQVAR